MTTGATTTTSRPAPIDHMQEHGGGRKRVCKTK